MTSAAATGPVILAVDSSTRFASVAVVQGPTLLGEYNWRAGQNHTQQLMPVVRAVLYETGTSVDALEAVAVALGPGSFNGLRAGMATAKAMASALGLPLLAAGTLEVEAYAHAAVPYRICAIHDAGRGEVAWATFSGPLDAWRQTAPERITQPAGLLEALRDEERVLVCGEVPEWCLQALREALADRLVLAGPAASVRRASFLAEIARLRLAAGRTEDLRSLEPLYLRRPPISSPRKRL